MSEADQRKAGRAAEKADLEFIFNATTNRPDRGVRVLALRPRHRRDGLFQQSNLVLKVFDRLGNPGKIARRGQ